MVMSWRFMIASSIFSMVLCGVKEFGCNSFKISVLKGEVKVGCLYGECIT